MKLDRDSLERLLMTLAAPDIGALLQATGDPTVFRAYAVLIERLLELKDGPA
jgi:hypothetical protein